MNTFLLFMIIIIIIIICITYNIHINKDEINDNNFLSETNIEKVLESSILGKEQQKLYDKMENSNDNLYITGKAGSGKSFLLKYFKEHSQKIVAVVAPTGVAAINVGGQTINSFFNLDFEVQDINNNKQMQLNYKTATILRTVDTIVIDEVSMVRVDVMNAIDKKLQLANNNTLPFGGKQIIMFGDLFQLPPVVTDGQLRRYLDDTYGSCFFFAAPVFKRKPLHIYELKDIYRQKDQEFINILNNIRIGKIIKEELDVLNKRVKKLPDENFITLTSTNAIASRINNEKLNKLETKEYTYDAIITGKILESSFPTDSKLKLKVGAQVMMLVNDTADSKSSDLKRQRRWVNGTLGIITELNENIIKVSINGVIHSINKYTWNKIEYEYDSYEKKLISETVATFTQFPVKLAWAITIHKAQGQTYQSVAIDIGSGAFEIGQIYVALSRCVSLENLYLKQQLLERDIKISQEILDFNNTNIINNI